MARRQYRQDFATGACGEVGGRQVERAAYGGRGVCEGKEEEDEGQEMVSLSAEDAWVERRVCLRGKGYGGGGGGSVKWRECL